MGIIKEFKNFAIKGNVMQLAVAVVIGNAFGKIVNSFVADLIMPPIGILIGGIDLKQFKLMLKGGDQPVYLTYGNFLQIVVEFFIIAASVFLIVKILNRIAASENKKEEEKVDTNIQLLTEIRDLLKQHKL